MLYSVWLLIVFTNLFRVGEHDVLSIIGEESQEILFCRFVRLWATDTSIGAILYILVMIRSQGMGSAQVLSTGDTLVDLG